jgi:cytochrome oxidase Cu insertion factor (SCO1/SenC/PrrC family)
MIFLRTGCLCILLASLCFATKSLGAVSIASGFILCGHTDSSDTLELIVEKDWKEVQTGGSSYSVRPDNSGYFSFHIASIPAIGCRIRLLVHHGETTELTQKASLIEQQDSIYVMVLTNAVRFSGKGSEKFVCQQALAAVYDRQPSSSLLAGFSTDAMLAYVDSSYHRQFQDLMSILIRFQTKLSESVYAIMEADVQGRLQLDYLIQAAGGLLTIDRLDTASRGARFLDTLGQQYPNLHPYSAYSPVMGNFLINQATLRITVKRHSFSYSMLDTYAVLCQCFHGLLLDRLLFNMLLFGNSEVGISSATQDSLRRVVYMHLQDTVLKAYVAKSLLRTAQGSPAYRFRLPDNHGHMVSLDQLRGKVLLLDFWFTGCGGCASYSARLEQSIYPVFDDCSDVVFLSINGDKDRDTWINSLQTTTYSRPKNINVYTGGLGFNHSFTRYYDIDGGPNSILIDREGRILYFNPSHYDMPSLIQNIKAALAH